MKKSSKGSYPKIKNSKLLLVSLTEAENYLELARKKALLAKTAAKAARRAFKQARKAAKQARKLAKAALKAEKSKSLKPRKKAKPAPARKPKFVAPQAVFAAVASP